MSKRRAKKNNSASLLERVPAPLAQALDAATDALEKGNARAAIEQLTQLTQKYQRSASLFGILGSAYLEIDDLFSAAVHLRKSLELMDNPVLYRVLGSVYSQLELTGLALDTFRRIRRKGLDSGEEEFVAAAIAELEQEAGGMAEILGLNQRNTEEALRLLGDGQLALHDEDYQSSLTLNRRAIRIAGLWPPMLNNMSLAYFFSGNHEDAIGTAEQVLAAHPENIHALSNLIHFLVLSGEADRARGFWKRLEPIPHVDRTSWLKKVDAAAQLEDHAGVFALFQAREKEADTMQPWSEREALYLAAALANLGLPGAAEVLADLEDPAPQIVEMRVALTEGRPGPGWAPSYPYHSTQELLPHKEIVAFFELLAREDHLPEAKFRREIERYRTRFPQLVLFAKKMILEMQQYEFGVQLLVTLGTSQAYAVLREIGLGQLATDEVRMKALMALQMAGQFQPGEKVRAWLGGRWEEAELRTYEVGGERERSYAPAVQDLLDRGARALNGERADEAERLLQRALQLEPQAVEGYSNLGVLYNRRNQPEKAVQMYRKAIAIDPEYVFPRCNLALNLINRDEIEAAEEVIRPAAKVLRMGHLEAALLGYVQARLHLAHEDYKSASKSLEMSLGVLPDFQPALDLLAELETYERVFDGLSSWREESSKRNRAKRTKLQEKQGNPAPALRAVLELYSKDQLTGMARGIIRFGGWSALKKAALIERIMEELTDPDGLATVVHDLTPVEATALRKVLGAGGALDWEGFDQEFGNDLETSPYWNWHPAETVMGRLRSLGLLAEGRVEGELLLCVPVELRAMLGALLADS